MKQRTGMQTLIRLTHLQLLVHSRRFNCGCDGVMQPLTKARGAELGRSPLSHSSRSPIHHCGHLFICSRDGGEELRSI